jgi:hypothetical protein
LTVGGVTVGVLPPQATLELGGEVKNVRGDHAVAQQLSADLVHQDPVRRALASTRLRQPTAQLVEQGLLSAGEVGDAGKVELL